MENAYMLIPYEYKNYKLIIDNVIIKKAASSNVHRMPIYKFWYQIYYKEMNRMISDVNHSKKIIYDDLEPDSVIYTIEFDDKIIASVRLTESEKMLNSKYNLMLYPVIKENYIFLTKLMITRECRKLNLSKKLLAEAEKFTKSKNKKILVLDCNDYMIPYFKKAGFVLASNNSVHSPHYGEVYIMKKEI